MPAGSSRKPSWRLSAADSFHAELNGNVLASIHNLDRRPDRVLLEESFQAVVGQFPRLACRLVEEPRPHLEPLNGFTPGDAIELRSLASSEQLMAEASRVYTAPFAPDRPPWRLVILSTQTPAPTCSAVLCFHHAVLDGIGMRDFLKALDIASDPSKKRQEFSRDASFAARRTLRQHPIRRIAASMAREFKLGSSRPLGLVQGFSSRERRLTVVDLSRTPIRRVCRVAGAGVVPVLLVLVADALARYAGRKPGDRPLRMMVPQAVEHRGSHVMLGNQYAPIVVDVPISDSPPLECIRPVDLDRSAALAGAPLEFSVLQMSVLAKMPRRLRHFCYRRWAAGIDLICSILPSDVEGIRLGGARVQSHYGFAPLPQGHGLSVTILCADKHLRVGLLTDPAIVAAPERLVATIKQAYESLVSAVG